MDYKLTVTMTAEIPSGKAQVVTLEQGFTDPEDQAKVQMGLVGAAMNVMDGFKNEVESRRGKSKNK